jgi:hypothetical protein
VIRAAGRPDLDRSVDGPEIGCSAGVRALEYHAPAGIIAKLFPLRHRSPTGARTVATICIDQNDRVVETHLVHVN